MRLALLALCLLASPAFAQPTPGGPAAHRLLFAPTARPIPAGEWRLGLTEFVIPNVSAGVGKGVSLGAGVIAGPEPILSGIVFVEPKVTVVDRPGLAVALGATGRIDPFHAYGVDANIFPYAVTTLETGSEPGSLAATLGLGARINVERRLDPSVYYGDVLFVPQELSIRAPEPREYQMDIVPAPAVFAGLEMRASERVTLLLEATALPDRNQAVFYPYCDYCAYLRSPSQPEISAYLPVHYNFTGGAALRYATRRLALDGGLGVVRSEDAYTDPLVEPAPWVNVTFGLGK